MIYYLIRRVFYALPILLAVNAITFLLFFVVNTPDDMARAHLGDKHVTQMSIDGWKKQHGYDKPLFYAKKESGLNQLTETLFFKKSLSLFVFDFGMSDQGRDIGCDIKERMWPSLFLAVPTLLASLFVNISLALFLSFFRGLFVDRAGVFSCVILMSVSGLFYIIVGQYFFGKLLYWVPISGYQGGFSAIKFLLLPVFIVVFFSIGAGVRWYRTLFLEEIHKEYVISARAKGLSNVRVLYRHVLKNALIPIFY